MESLLILCSDPFKVYSFDELEIIFLRFSNDASSMPANLMKIPNENCFPVLELSLASGSEFIVFGKFKFESDLPKKCFKKVFKSDEKNIQDYFECKTCQLRCK